VPEAIMSAFGKFHAATKMLALLLVTPVLLRSNDGSAIDATAISAAKTALRNFVFVVTMASSQLDLFTS
jgi:hypothetical protein